MTDQTDPAFQEAIRAHADAGMVIQAPWTDEQVTALNRWQFGPMHPFTCPSEYHSIEVRIDPNMPGWAQLKEALEAAVAEGVIEDADLHIDESTPRPGNVSLVATRDGWRCPIDMCGYTQDWAHEFMARTEVLEGMVAQLAGLAGGDGPG